MSKLKWLVIALLAIGVTIVAGLRLWELWTGSSDETAELVGRLQAEASELEHKANQARDQAADARQALQNVQRESTEKRAALERERAGLVARNRRLEGQISALRTELERLPTGHPELDSVALAEKAQTALADFSPPASDPPLIQARPLVFEANRPAIAAALEAAERSLLQLRTMTLQERRILELERLFRNAEVTGGTFKTERDQAIESGEVCRRALAAGRQLEENRLQQLDARATQVKQLERRVWKQRIEKYGFTAAAFGAGLLIGRQVQ